MGKSNVQQFVPLKKVGTSITPKAAGDTLDAIPIGSVTPAAGKFTTVTTVTSKITGGQLVAKINAGAADYNPSALTDDYIITVDTTAAARAVIISAEDKATGSATNVRTFIIQDIAGNASVHNITVSLETAGDINDAGTFVINSDYGAITLIVDGTNGYVV